MPLKDIKQLWSIPKEEMERETYAEVQHGMIFKGHNLWLLAAAMVIACIGLNSDNGSAVIGAMLISPLMGPVIGFAFGISIKSRSMMRLSAYNWLIMVSTSLAASTLFFLLTPFHYETAQLQGFAQATIFDVMLAFAGGVAGFLGIIRKEAIKVIAGVAVATACIPPLCTAGFGLATWQLNFLLGGLYLFFINCFFIGLGTWISSSALGYGKYYTQYDAPQKRRSAGIITVVGLLLLVPSVWLAVQKWQKQSLAHASQQYVDKIQTDYPELVVVKHHAYEKNKKRFVEISLLNDSSEISESSLFAADRLDTTIQVVWHFAPDRFRKEAAALRNDVSRLDSIVLKQDSIL